MKKALISGIAGQDGSYLAEHLLECGYEVHGIVRGFAMDNPNHMNRILHLQDKIKLHCTPLESSTSVFKIISTLKPDECYHLAANSFVSYSLANEFFSLSAHLKSTYYFLSAIKKYSPHTKFPKMML
jgi:GDPmannose 4,6-dehydratase